MIDAYIDVVRKTIYSNFRLSKSCIYHVRCFDMFASSYNVSFDLLTNTVCDFISDNSQHVSLKAMVTSGNNIGDIVYRI